MNKTLRIIFILLVFVFLVSCRQKNRIDEIASKIFAHIDLQMIDDDLVLPPEIDDVTITWISSKPEIVTASGHVYRQEEDVKVELYAYFNYQNVSKVYNYKLKVKGLTLSVSDRLEYVKKILLREEYQQLVTADLILPPEINKVKISWVSSDQTVMDNTGRVFPQAADIGINLYAYLSYGDHNAIKTFNFIVARYQKEDWDTLLAVENTLFGDIDFSKIECDLNFPTEINGVALSWFTDMPTVMSNTGKVYRGKTDSTVKITVLLSYNSVKKEKEFYLTVLADDSENYALVEAVKEGLLKNVNLDAIVDNLDLPLVVNGVMIKWKSSNPTVVNENGQVTRPELDCMVTLTATLTYNQASAVKIFYLRIKAREINDDDLLWLNTVKSNLLTDVDLDNIISDLYFPTEISDVALIWSTNHPNVINSEGGVTRDSIDIVVSITVYLEYKGLSDRATFTATVKKIEQSLSEYYRGAEGLSGQELKNLLNNKIKGHYTYGYSSTTDLLKKTDEDPNNPLNVILFYTGRSEPKSSYNNQIWNKEHVWAKSHGNFGTSIPAGSDIHNLRPADNQVNSIRSNYDFDEGGKIVDCNRGYGLGSSYSYYRSGYSFEPRDEVKGDVARILFYMATRYEGEGTEPDLELNDKVQNGTAPYHGRLSVLLRWNKEDPVDNFERNRNEVIYGYQNNRNPFIDYPHFADLIWGEEYHVNDGVMIPKTALEIIVDIEEIRKNKYLWA